MGLEEKDWEKSEKELQSIILQSSMNTWRVEKSVFIVL